MKKELALLIFVVLISGCSQTNKGNLELQITDPSHPELSDLDISKVEITISSIEVHKANMNNNSGWSTIVEEPRTYDLIEIIDVYEIIGSNTLEAGKYTQIRLNVDSASAVINGVEYDLIVPSDKIKIVRNFDIIENETTMLILDFDAYSSVIKSGDKYEFKPVIQILKENEKEDSGLDTNGRDIKNQIKEANYCNVKEDCVWVGSKCPFGCNIYVNVNEENRIKDLLDNYIERCAYACVPVSSVECINNKCVVNYEIL